VAGIKFVWDSLHSLDQKTHAEGYTPFHLALFKSNQMILRYIIQMYRQRDYLRLTYYQGKHVRRTEYTLEQIKELPCYIDRMTPLLMAVSAGQYETFMYLFTELGCNIEAVDAKKNNALHLALKTNNMDLIRQLIHIDSDYGTVREQRNALG